MVTELEFGFHTHTQNYKKYWEDMTDVEKQQAICDNLTIYHRPKTVQGV